MAELLWPEVEIFDLDLEEDLSSWWWEASFEEWTIRGRGRELDGVLRDMLSSVRDFCWLVGDGVFNKCFP